VPAIIRADGTVIHYGALERGIDRMAAHATSLGLSAGDTAVLSVLPPDEATALILMLALARIGVTTADPSLPGHQGIVLQPAGSSETRPGTVAFRESWLRDDAPEAAIHDDPAAPCRIFSSSGTTGRPKFVAISHDLMAKRVFARWLGLSGGAAVRMIGIGLDGAWGYLTVLRTLWSGGTIVLFDPRDPFGPMHRHGVSQIALSPLALRSFLGLMPRDAPPPPALETIEVGGSMVPHALLREAMARLCPDILVYLGSTEVGGMAAAAATTVLAESQIRPGLVGAVFNGMRIQAVDDADEPLPPGKEGLLRVGADTMPDGYLGEREADEGFRGGWFYPGDIGVIWPDGMLSLTGRASEIINKGGIKISPAVIEERLLGLPGVIEAAAFSVPDEGGIDRIWACIVADPPVDQKALDRFCDQTRAGLAPDVILRLTALPKTESGKVMRRALREMAVRMERDAP
jgi:acyl-coenzyme A synthetase/AMP-(fatty) acid ligase